MHKRSTDANQFERETREREKNGLKQDNSFNRVTKIFKKIKKSNFI